MPRDGELVLLGIFGREVAPIAGYVAAQGARDVGSL
jgi:hypothetical protein